MRILIVDDNEASAQTLGWMIELMGHEVRLAHDGRKSIDIAKEFGPAIIMLDIGLPSMNGYEVCKAMRCVASLENSVIIAQTGWGQEEHRQLSKDAGFDHHLVKPIQMSQLEALLLSIGQKQVLDEVK